MMVASGYPNNEPAFRFERLYDVAAPHHIKPSAFMLDRPALPTIT